MPTTSTVTPKGPSFFTQGWDYAAANPTLPMPDAIPLEAEAASVGASVLAYWKGESWVEGFLAQRDFVYAREAGKESNCTGKSTKSVLRRKGK